MKNSRLFFEHFVEKTLQKTTKEKRVRLKVFNRQKLPLQGAQVKTPKFIPNADDPQMRHD